jgi:hypothetical protein
MNDLWQSPNHFQGTEGQVLSKIRSVHNQSPVGKTKLAEDLGAIDAFCGPKHNQENAKRVRECFGRFRAQLLRNGK